MQKFVDMVFAETGHALLMTLESTIYNYADKYIEGYNGGTWTESVHDGIPLLIAPTNGKARVNLVNADNYCDVETDANTAGTAISIMVLNHLIWRYHNKGDIFLAEKIQDVWERVLEAARECPTLDHDSLHAFLD